MMQEVKADAPHPKKLFEWDPVQRMLQIIIKGQKYTCLLGNDNLFRNIAIKPKSEE